MQSPIIWGRDGASAYVGVTHGKPLHIKPADATSLKVVGNKAGFYYEGNGADQEAAETSAVGHVRWSGSWDELVEPRDEAAFYYTLFSNGGPSRDRMILKLVAPGRTILQSLVSHGDSISHEALRGADHMQGVPAFLRACRGGLLKMAETLPARSDALKAFISRGEKLMWSSSQAGADAAHLARTANEERMKTIARRHGVFFLGRDLLPILARVIHKGAN